MESIIRQGDPFFISKENIDVMRRIFSRFHIKRESYIDLDQNICQLPPSQVGVINLPSKTIVINPRHEGIEIRHILRIYYFVSNSMFSGTPDDPDYDLDDEPYRIDLSKPYVQELREVVRRGVPSIYLTKAEDLSFIRGKLDPIKTELNLLRRRSKPISATFDEISLKNRINKILSAALWKLKDKIAVQDFVFLANSLPFCSYDEAISYVDSVILNRNTGYCRKAFDLARMILKELFFVDLGEGAHGEAFLINYDLLFEEFIRVILRDYSGDSKFSSWANNKAYAEYQEKNQTFTRSYRPDILYDHRNGLRFCSFGVIDAKNKTSEPFSNVDIFQLQFYASLLSAQKLILVYPSTERKNPKKLIMRADGPTVQEVNAVYIDLTGNSGHEFAESIYKLCNDVMDCLWNE